MDHAERCEKRQGIERPQSSRLRKGRISEAYGLYFVTKRLIPGSHFSEIQKEHAVEAFSWFSQKGLWGLHAFVIMPDHWHVLFSLGESIDLSSTIEKLSRRISFPTRQAGLSGIPWQPGFYDHKIRPDEAITDIVDYVEKNPVRKGLCELSEKWPWSSKNTNYASLLHREFLGHKRWASRNQSRIS